MHLDLYLLGGVEKRLEHENKLSNATKEVSVFWEQKVESADPHKWKIKLYFLINTLGLQQG